MDPTLAPSLSIDISGSFQRARLLFSILNFVNIKHKERKKDSVIILHPSFLQRNSSSVLPFSLRLGLHRCNGSFDWDRYHQVTQSGRSYLSVGVEFIIEPDIRLRILALPIGNQMQRSRSSSTFRFHLVLIKTQDSVTNFSSIQNKQTNNEMMHDSNNETHWERIGRYLQYVNVKVRSRRILLGLTFQQLSQLWHIEVE